MKVRHPDGREQTNVTEGEFFRTFGPAGFFPVEDASGNAASDESVDEARGAGQKDAPVDSVSTLYDDLKSENEQLKARVAELEAEQEPIELEAFDLDTAIQAAYAHYDTQFNGYESEDFAAFKDALTKAFLPDLDAGDTDPDAPESPQSDEGKPNDSSVVQDVAGVDLTKLKFVELKAKATEVGVLDVERFKSKAEVIDAIEEHLTAPSGNETAV